MCPPSPFSDETSPKEGHVGWPSLIALGLLKVYKYGLSPVFYAIGIRCRHEPTCSAYSADAISAQGLWRGGWLTLGRFLRCRPGGTHGYDPAPQTPTLTPWWKVWAFRDNPRSVR